MKTFVYKPYEAYCSDYLTHDQIIRKWDITSMSGKHHSLLVSKLFRFAEKDLAIKFSFMLKYYCQRETALCEKVYHKDDVLKVYNWLIRNSVKKGSKYSICLSGEYNQYHYKSIDPFGGVL